MQPDALAALPPNSETLVDREPAVLSLVLGWEEGRRRLHRDDLRLADPVGVPFVDDGHPDGGTNSASETSVDTEVASKVADPPSSVAVEKKSRMPPPE